MKTGKQSKRNKIYLLEFFVISMYNFCKNVSKEEKEEKGGDVIERERRRCYRERERRRCYREREEEMLYRERRRCYREREKQQP